MYLIKIITSTTLITGMTLPNIENLEVGMSIFPNPSPGGLNTIKYMLPTGINNGEISIFDLSGKEVKHYMVDANFSDVVISENELTPGTYIYSLKAEGKLIESKKIIITGN